MHVQDLQLRNQALQTQVTAARAEIEHAKQHTERLEQRLAHQGPQDAADSSAAAAAAAGQIAQLQSELAEAKAIIGKLEQEATSNQYRIEVSLLGPSRASLSA